MDNKKTARAICTCELTNYGYGEFNGVKIRQGR